MAAISFVVRNDLKITYHFALVLIYTIASFKCHADVYKNIEETGIHEAKDLHFELMLTVWYWTLHVFYFYAVLFRDLYNITEPNNKLSAKWEDRLKFIFFALVFPVALGISITFWSIFWYDRELVFPVIMDQLIPLWSNHLCHTNVVIVSLVEMLFVKYDSVLSDWKYHSRSLKLLLGLIWFYVFCLYLTKVITGHWLYPVFNQVPILLMTSVTIPTVVMYYFLGIVINIQLQRFITYIEESSQDVKSKVS